MKAAVFQGVGIPLTIEAVPDPTPQPHEAVIRVDRCGICGSDLHMTEGNGYSLAHGTVLGHEFAGEVVALGSDVERLKVGDRVAALPIFGCGTCRHCLSGVPAYCALMRVKFGGFADFAVVSEFTAVRVPETVSLKDAALAEPLAVALHGLCRARLQPGSNVTVLGAGPIGLAALFWAKRLGAHRVDVVEGASSRAEIAWAMGADSVTSPSDTARAPTLSEPPDLVVECVGRSGLLSESLDIVGRGGTVVSLGFCFQPERIVAAHAASKEVGILFPKLYTQREFEFAVNILERDAASAARMITRQVSYDELPNAFESLRSTPEDCKILLAPQGA